MMRVSFILFLSCNLAIVKAFTPIDRKTPVLKRTIIDVAENCASLNVEKSVLKRRSFLGKIVASFTTATVLSPQKARAMTSDVNGLLTQLKEARSQLDPVPSLIKEEKWDAVRAILITPPLADCWAKTSKPLLKLYAEAQGELPNGDEFAALELREEALDHLRFLDMAVYNNVFNPIKTEGENGATKELIRSYYEDPVNEFKASVKVLDELIALGK